MAKAKQGTYSDGNYPDTEHLESVDVAHGFKVGDRVEFLSKFADDIPAGRQGVIVGIDTHPTMPLTVDVHMPDGQGMVFGVPVFVSEVRKVDDSPETPAQEAVSAPQSAEGDEPQAVAA